MTAHSPETAEAADVRSFDTANDAAAALDKYFDAGGEPDDDEELDDDALEADEADDVEASEDEADDDEPGEPAIEAPASLTADEKAIFAAASPEAQRVWAASEIRRNEQVQQATTKAAEREREAQAFAASARATATAEAKQMAAQQAVAIAQRYVPQPPPASLAQQDYVAYTIQKARYDEAIADYQQTVGEAQSLWEQGRAEIEAEETASLQRQAQACLDELPELKDGYEWQALLQRLTPFAKSLGYSDEELRNAGPVDVRAMKRLAAIQEDADKWRGLQKRKMQPVRDAKSTKPGTARPIGAGKVRMQTETQQRLRQTGDVRDAARAIAALG